MNTKRTVLLAGLLAGAGLGVSWGQSQAAPGRLDEPLPASETGSIKGTFASTERLKTRGATSQKDVVIFLQSADPKPHEAPKEPIVVKQEKLQFMTHVLPVLKGSRVLFENLDGVLHNVYCVETCCPMDEDIAAGASKAVQFDEVGVASIVCRVHPEMTLWVAVFDEPWFTSVQLEKSKAEGQDRLYSSEYELEHVPPGTYTLSFWNKKLTPQKYVVSVEAGKETVLDILIEGE